MRVAVRLYVDGVKITEDACETDTADALSFLSERHIKAIEERGGKAHFMVEVEFLDEQGEDRFFRFGTDPRGMIQPLPISFDKPN